MFDRFTEMARRTLVTAQEEAQSLGHGFIGPEHVLLGLMRHGQRARVGLLSRLTGRRGDTAARPSGEGAGYEALAGFGITVDAVRREVEKLTSRAEGAAGDSVPFSPACKQVIERSMHEAVQLHHDYISVDHLLLAVLGDRDGVGPQALATLGADAPRVRRRVVELLGAGGTVSGPSPPTGAAG